MVPYRTSPICTMYVAAHRVQSLAHSCVHVGKAWMPDSCVLHQSIDKLEKTVNKGLKMVLCSSYSSETMNSSREFPIFHGLRVGIGP